MKQLTCELCGSTDLLKTDGVFICQSCGTKYSVEEAKKLMIEGIVEVKGNVTVNEPIRVKGIASVDNKLQNAIMTYNLKNYQEAYKLFNEVINLDPNNEFAILYRGLSNGWTTNLVNGKVYEAVDSFIYTIKLKYESDQGGMDYCKFITSGLYNLSALISSYKKSWENHYNKFSDQTNTQKDYKYQMGVIENSYMKVLNSIFAFEKSLLMPNESSHLEAILDFIENAYLNSDSNTNLDLLINYADKLDLTGVSNKNLFNKQVSIINQLLKQAKYYKPINFPKYRMLAEKYIKDSNELNNAKKEYQRYTEVQQKNSQLMVKYRGQGTPVLWLIMIGLSSVFWKIGVDTTDYIDDPLLEFFIIIIVFIWVLSVFFLIKSLAIAYSYSKKNHS